MYLAHHELECAVITIVIIIIIAILIIITMVFVITVIIISTVTVIVIILIIGGLLTLEALRCSEGSSSIVNKKGPR